MPDLTPLPQWLIDATTPASGDSHTRQVWRNVAAAVLDGLADHLHMTKARMYELARQLREGNDA